jgi:hypothetical protein
MSPTQIRVPFMRGLPKQIEGSMSIRSGKSGVTIPSYGVDDLANELASDLATQAATRAFDGSLVAHRRR